MFFTTRLHKGEILLFEHKGILFQCAVAEKSQRLFLSYPGQVVIIFRIGFRKHIWLKKEAFEVTLKLLGVSESTIQFRKAFITVQSTLTLLLKES